MAEWLHTLAAAVEERKKEKRMSLKERIVHLVELLPLNNALVHKERKNMP